MIKSINFKISSIQTLLIRTTLKPRSFRTLSFSSAAFILSFPHLYDESISIQSFFSGIKKSMLYVPIGFCISYLINFLSRNTLKAFSWGRILSENVFCILFARFERIVESLFNIRMLSELASEWSRNFSLVNLHRCINGVCYIPHILAILFIERHFFQCNSLITLSNGIPKNASIFSLDVILMEQEITMEKGSGQTNKSGEVINGNF